jgi:hypothetical protein
VALPSDRLDRERRRALVAEGLAAALIEAGALNRAGEEEG